MARRSARNTSFGRRARCASSLKVSDPKSSVTLRCAWGGRLVVPLRMPMPQSLMFLIAAPDDAEPMVGVSFRFGVPVVRKEDPVAAHTRQTLCGHPRRRFKNKTRLSEAIYT